jgi:hypothetical protein
MMLSKVALLDGGRALRLEWSDGKAARFHAL